METKPQKKLKKKAVTLKHKFFCGQSGAGKSTFVKNAVINWAKDYSLVVFLNTQHEEFIDAISIYHADNTDKLQEHIEDGRRLIIYTIPLLISKFDSIEKFESEEVRDYNKLEFRKLIMFLWLLKYKNPKKKLLLIVDEADLFCSANYMPEMFEEILTKGRKYHFEVCTITQRPQLIAKTILTQSKTIYFFKTSEYDYKFLSKWFDYENPELYDYVIIEN